MAKYFPLYRSLTQLDSGRETIEMAFRDLESILGGELPKTARNNRAWWSNNRNHHSQAGAWLDAGFLVNEVDLCVEQVSFIRKAR